MAQMQPTYFASDVTPLLLIVESFSEINSTHIYDLDYVWSDCIEFESKYLPLIIKPQKVSGQSCKTLLEVQANKKLH